MGDSNQKNELYHFKPTRDILLIPTDLEQRDKKDTVAVFQTDDILNYNLVPKVLSLDELVTRSFLFCVPRPMTSGYMNKKALWKLCEKANMAGFKCFASLSWTNPLQKKKKKNLLWRSLWCTHHRVSFSCVLYWRHSVISTVNIHDWSVGNKWKLGSLLKSGDNRISHTLGVWSSAVTFNKLSKDFKTVKSLQL